jgi:hypothetical protein
MSLPLLWGEKPLPKTKVPNARVSGGAVGVAQLSAGIRKTVRKQPVRQRPASESPAATCVRAGLLVTSDVVQRVTPD